MYSLLRYTQRLPLALPLLSIAFVSTSVSFIAFAKKEQLSTLTSPLLCQQTATPWYQSTSITPSNMTITTTPPIQEGQLFFPAETAPHLATILGFPSPHAVPRELLRATRNEILDLAVTISEFEPVRVHVRAEDETLARETLIKRYARLVDMYSSGDGDGKGKKKKKKKKKGKVDDGEIPQYNLDNVTFHTCPTNHPWVRDTAPVYVLDTTNPGKRVAIDFGFCEWGGKNHGEIDVRDELVLQEYKDARDERAPINRTGYEIPDKRHWENSRFAKQVLEVEAHANDTNMSTANGTNQHIERITSPVRLEGGGIEVDGNGTLLATESSILCRYRNDDMSKATIEMHLRRLLGVSKIIWFPGRRDHDITDCHVDGEVKFLAPGLVVLSKPHKRAEKVEKEIYKEIRDILTHETDAQGRKFKIVEMEGPDLEKVGWSDEDYGYEEAYENEDFDEEDEEDEDVAGTYVNFYFVNGGLILPAFGDKRQDRRAVETLRKWIEPERKIRQVYTSALPRMGGVVHCVTQQVV